MMNMFEMLAYIASTTPICINTSYTINVTTYIRKRVGSCEEFDKQFLLQTYRDLNPYHVATFLTPNSIIDCLHRMDPNYVWNLAIEAIKKEQYKLFSECAKYIDIDNFVIKHNIVGFCYCIEHIPTNEELTECRITIGKEESDYLADIPGLELHRVVDTAYLMDDQCSLKLLRKVNIELLHPSLHDEYLMRLYVLDPHINMVEYATVIDNLKYNTCTIALRKLAGLDVKGIKYTNEMMSTVLECEFIHHYLINT